MKTGRGVQAPLRSWLAVLLWRPLDSTLLSVRRLSEDCRLTTDHHFSQRGGVRRGNGVGRGLGVGVGLGVAVGVGVGVGVAVGVGVGVTLAVYLNASVWATLLAL
jgi:hypothetical protein